MLGEGGESIRYLVWYLDPKGTWTLRFFVKPSRIEIPDPSSRPGALAHDSHVGDGLFSTRPFPKDTYLTYYDGIVRQADEIESLLKKPEGAFLMTLDTNQGFQHT